MLSKIYLFVTQPPAPPVVLYIHVKSAEFACSLTLWAQTNLNVSISSDLPFNHFRFGSLPMRVFCLWFPLCGETAPCLLRPLGETDTGLSFLPVLRSISLACLTTSIFLLASLQCECWTALESGALLEKYVKMMTMTAAQHEVVTHFHYTPITSSTSVRVKRPQQSHFLLGPKLFLLVMKILEVEIRVRKLETGSITDHLLVEKSYLRMWL